MLSTNTFSFFDTPRRVCNPGELPMRYLDQREVWVDVNGFEHRVASMERDFVLWTLDYLLANAAKVRNGWSAETRQSFDTTMKARRWMLERPIVKALMERYLELDP